MKSCLKGTSLPGSPVPGSSSHKCVVFCEEGSEEVHWADEWDRTPTQPARRLSYQELLELKEIQQSLPHASQPGESSRPGKQLLAGVPIGLLPLNSPETVSSPVSPPPQSPESGNAYQTPFLMPPGRARPKPPPPRLASPGLTHLRPLAPPAPRPKPAFSFLPLLSQEPPCIQSAPPASTAFTSDSSQCDYPPARAAADGEPDRVLPLASRPRAIQTTGSAHPVHGYEHAYCAAEAAAYSPPFGSSAYDYSRDRRDMLAPSISRSESSGATATASGSSSAGTPIKKKKKSFMMINDVAVEIEEDDEEEEAAVPAPSVKTPLELASPPQTERTKPPAALALPPTSPTAEKSPDPPQVSPRLAVRPLSPVAARPTSPLTPLSPGRATSPVAATAAAAAGRLSPAQARSSSRLVRV
ncbi:hypothetical protein DFH07DRAFT_463438 [Mycena maculata]|uniref:Uncharacterized protein n=1 Tax=Mycena maculata TaxID=230809 RepID=A0AAD7NYA4_9AGAR|nr:hypothetical protein DFH07DRAFT_463438 [Mycena maculata]